MARLTKGQADLLYAALGHTHFFEAFPVGAVYISTVATNPSESLGYGIWEAFGGGRVLVGIDEGQTEFDALGKIGGAKTHQLSVDEMPSHTHVQQAHTHTQSSHNHTANRRLNATGFGNAELVAGTGGTSGGQSTANATPAINSTMATNNNTGGGQAHNNLQPYIVCYFWKRVS